MQANSILFIDTVNELMGAMDKAERVIKEIMAAPDYGNLVDEVSATGNKVTVLESLVLSMRARQLNTLCDNIVLIDYVRKKDPQRIRFDSKGNSWYALAKDGTTVNAIRSVRESLDYRRIDIKDAKLIVEMVQAGLL